MRASGVPERFCTGDAAPRDKFLAWAKTVPQTLRNPLYHWTHLELRRAFDIDAQLSPATSRMIFDRCNERLREDGFTLLGLLRRFRVAVAITDNPPVNQKWFLRKHEDGNTFGPVQFDQITRWAAAAQIAPHDTLSSDGQTWVKAPMVPQLSMDWLLELTSEDYYGPTTLGTLREFVRLGEIDGETVVINSCDGTRRQVREMPDLWEAAPSRADDRLQFLLG